MAQVQERKVNAALPVVYEVDGMPVKLTFSTVRDLICRGQRHKPTDEEVMAFIEFCRYMKANPFIGDAHLIKYSERDPASFVVGVDYHVKTADKNPQYDGYEAGIIVRTADGKLEERIGAFLLDDEDLLGGWCRVYRKDRSRPVTVKVNLDRYQKMRFNEKTGKWEPQALWRTNAADMIMKVAISQAHRKAFPKDLRGAYTEDEIRPETVDAEVVAESDEERTLEHVKAEAFAFFRERGLEFSDEDMTAYMEHAAEALGLPLAATIQRALEGLGDEKAWERFVQNFKRFVNGPDRDPGGEGAPAPKPSRRRGRPPKKTENQAEAGAEVEAEGHAGPAPPDPQPEAAPGEPDQPGLFDEDLWRVWQEIPEDIRKAAQESLGIARPMSDEALERLIQEANRIADEQRE